MLDPGDGFLRQVGVLAAQHAAEGATMSTLTSAATTNATSVKASAGTLFYIVASNLNAAVRYLKFYNKASAPTVGTDAVVWKVALKVSTDPIVIVMPAGLKFTTGIAFALTTGIADTDTGAVAANELIVNLGYA